MKQFRHPDVVALLSLITNLYYLCNTYQLTKPNY